MQILFYNKYGNMILNMQH